MPGRRFRIFTRQFKEAAVRRILAGEKIRTVATELRVRPQLLYTWRDHYEQGGADALVPRGRPSKAGAPARRLPADPGQAGLSDQVPRRQGVSDRSLARRTDRRG